MTRKDLNNHTIYVITWHGDDWPLGTEVELCLDDLTESPMFVKADSSSSFGDFRFIALKKLQPSRPMAKKKPKQSLSQAVQALNVQQMPSVLGGAATVITSSRGIINQTQPQMASSNIQPVNTVWTEPGAKFKPGERVKFVDKDGKEVKDDVSNASYSFHYGLAQGQHYFHGPSDLGIEYHNDKALIVGNIPGLKSAYLVRWQANGGSWVQLGFEEKNLRRLKEKEKFHLNEQALDALILEPSVKKEIIAVLKQHENRDKLFTEWGLGETIEYGRGMTMMFWGMPGTGKTWGAHCIAKALGQELMQISAAEIQSSEPGATERNLQQAFATAKEEKKVLFIDECDSIITTRSDLGMVLAAQVNCLLTEIEKFEGVCILATNRIETMDEALERRLALIVEFPFPKYAQRVQIWEKLLPKKMPLASGITAAVLAQPKFTGGQIKNIILQAARLAVAENKDAVEQADFDKATERLNKSKGIMGKVARSFTGRPGSDVYVTSSNNPQLGVSVDVSQTTDLKSFLQDDEEEEEGNKPTK